MSGVTVDVPPKAPKLTGDYQADMQAIYDCFVGVIRTETQLRERTGGSTDTVAANVVTANNAAATADASQAGADIPTAGGTVTLSPPNPITYTLISNLTARINVSAHARSDAGAPLIAASVSPDVSRGSTFYVYYSDAGNAGGAQTFLASASLSVVTGTAGYKIVGTVTIPAYVYNYRTTGGGVEP